MALLEDGADVDHGVGVGIGRREALDAQADLSNIPVRVLSVALVSGVVSWLCE